MAKQSYSTMPIKALLKLRDQIGAILSRRGKALQKQLSALGVGSESGTRRSSSLAGRKIAAKYRGPNGETWAGRGARPVWMRDALKAGKKPEHFLIAKPAKKRAAKKRKKAV